VLSPPFIGITKVKSGFAAFGIFQVTVGVAPGPTPRAIGAAVERSPYLSRGSPHGGRSIAPPGSGTGSADPRAWTPSPGTASDKGAGTLHPQNSGHAILSRSWWRTSPALASRRGPSGRDDLSKAGAISSQPRKARGHVRGKRFTSAPMKGYEQPIMMAPHDDAGLVGKARPCTSSVADTLNCAPASA
jgi:hypothetical protein